MLDLPAPPGWQHDGVGVGVVGSIVVVGISVVVGTGVGVAVVVVGSWVVVGSSVVVGTWVVGTGVVVGSSVVVGTGVGVAVSVEEVKNDTCSISPQVLLLLNVSSDLPEFSI
jgi:hypothetical protein